MSSNDNHEAHDFAERIRERLPRRLQELRELARLSKYGLPRESGISREFIGKIECGDVCPSVPVTSPNSSAEMRSQLTALNTGIQQQATINVLNNTIANTLSQTSNNSNGVATLGQGTDGSYNQTQMQDVLNKLDELINTLRR